MRTPAMIVIALAAFAACGEGKPDPAPVEATTPSVEPEPLDPNAAGAEQAALASCGPVTAEGYCGVTFGMAPDAAQAEFPVKLETYAGASVQDDPNQCYELFAAEPVQGVSFMVEAARVGRVDVLSSGPKTAEGFGVGTSGEEIRAKLGVAVSEQPNKYEPEITELLVSQGTAKFVFELQDGKVRAWRAGIAPTVDYVEHCG